MKPNELEQYVELYRGGNKDAFDTIYYETQKTVYLSIYNIIKNNAIKNLVLELENIAKGQKIEKIWLEVKETNKTAINFYEKLNFKFIAKRKHYYKSGEDALIYEKSTF